jgi:hypothetical protein
MKCLPLHHSDDFIQLAWNALYIYKLTSISAIYSTSPMFSSQGPYNFMPHRVRGIFILKLKGREIFEKNILSLKR